MRKASAHPEKLGSHTPPAGWILQTLPCPVVPSPVHRLPSRSKASPLVPGTPVAKAVAVGGVPSSGLNRHTMPPEAESATYRSPCASNAMPDALHDPGTKPTTVRADSSILQTGQGDARPVV